ncbi:hypothetical protein LH128_02944 [Sphingomonas sp. LH128]|nr:hypothetical protein LH128_02944 [Sphingomonas sp. LH128]
MHGLQGDRIDEAGLLAAALLTRRALDVGELEELPTGMSEASCFQAKPRLTAGRIKLAVAGIGILAPIWQDTPGFSRSTDMPVLTPCSKKAGRISP